MPAFSKVDARKVLAIGLLGVSSTLLLNDSLLVDDFARGLWAGVFLGIEALGVILLFKQRRSGKGGLGACPSYPLAD